MRIDVITGFPRLVEGPLRESILKRAQDKGLAEIVVHDLRAHTSDRHKTIDDAPYGGGAGMVLKPEPIATCIDTLRGERPYDQIVYLSADGEKFTQDIANRLSLSGTLMFLCGHYKGVDERIRASMVTMELSIGDYVLTGGELAALVVIDAVVRLIPGVLNDGESLLDDSFQDGLLGAPNYTRPPVFRGLPVPETLLNGNHADIARWRHEERLRRTRDRRKDMDGGQQ